jgi:hypothetical protein
MYVLPSNILESESVVRYPYVSNFCSPGTLALCVAYTENYPDELPELRLECIEGELNAIEREALESSMNNLVRFFNQVVSANFSAILIRFGTYCILQSVFHSRLKSK